MGVDVIASKGRRKIRSPSQAVQQASLTDCGQRCSCRLRHTTAATRAMVVTNNYFTAGARALARNQQTVSWLTETP